MSRFVLALDQGTSSSRSILFDASGYPVAIAQRELTQRFPQPGWVEHDAQEIWATQLATMEEVLADVGATAADIAAIGVTNQRETCLLWERATGCPLAPAIVWQDRRTAEECERLRALGHEPAVERRTGLRLDPYFSATKLGWLLDHVPRARERAERGELAFGTIDSWLIFNLSGRRAHVTDVTNASRTLLLDLDSAAWSDPMLSLFNIPRVLDIDQTIEPQGDGRRGALGWAETRCSYFFFFTWARSEAIGARSFFGVLGFWRSLPAWEATLLEVGIFTL